MLLDPDFLVLKPISLETLGLLSAGGGGERGGGDRAARWASRAAAARLRGRPVAHEYGLGAAWLRFDRAKICAPEIVGAGSRRARAPAPPSSRLLAPVGGGE